MNQYGIEQIKKRFNFEQWSSFTNLEQDLFIWNYFLTGKELPGLVMKHNQNVSLPGWPQSYQTVWCSESDRQDGLLRFDVYECSNRNNAHEFMIYMLKEFQLPLIWRESSYEIGDVFFHGKKDSVILFARANLVFMVSSIGKVSMPITELVQRYDNDLCSKPVTNEKCRADFDIRNFKALSQSPNNKKQVALDFEVYDITKTNIKQVQRVEPKNRQKIALYFKFFSSNGQVSVVEDQFVGKPASRGKNELVIYAVDDQQRAISSRYEFAYE